MNPTVIDLRTPTDLTAGVRPAVEALDAGELVVFPTETVYGIGARVDRPLAMRRLRELKGRTDGRPFTVHLGRKSDAERVAGPMNGVAARLVAKAWPGPVTLIVAVSDPAATPIGSGLSDDARAEVYHEGTVGLRFPDEPIAIELLSRVNGPVVASSANGAGLKPPTSAEEAAAELGERVAVILDSGRTRYAKPSTIVRAGDQSFQVLREGVFEERTIARLASLDILFVCSGNTCRSPMAAALGRRLLAQRLGCEPEMLADRHIYIDSAGTNSYNGAPASDPAVRAMARRGVDLSTHRSVALTRDAVRAADVVIVMTRAHQAAVTALDPTAARRTVLLRGDEDLTDPFGGSDQEYERCAQQIEAALPAALESLTL